jgi:hypothetical protein
MIVPFLMAISDKRALKLYLVLFAVVMINAVFRG